MKSYNYYVVIYKKNYNKNFSYYTIALFKKNVSYSVIKANFSLEFIEKNNINEGDYVISDKLAKLIYSIIENYEGKRTEIESKMMLLVLHYLQKK